MIRIWLDDKSGMGVMDGELVIHGWSGMYGWLQGIWQFYF